MEKLVSVNRQVYERSIFPGIFDTTAQQAYMENTEAYEQLFLDAEKIPHHPAGACRAALSRTARRLKITEVQHDNHGLKIHANTTCDAVFAPKMKLCEQRL